MPLIRLWNGWVDAVCATEHGRVLAGFRIAMGLLVLLDTLWLLAHDVVDPLYLPIADGGFAPANRFYSPWVDLFGHSVATTWGVFAAVVVLSALVTLGLGGRVVAFLLLQAVLVMHALPLDVGGGYDRFITNGLFLLVVGASSETWSVDCRLRTGRWTSDRPIYALARYLGIFQLVVVYVVTGFAKTGSGWHMPYDAVYHSLQRITYIRFSEVGWLGTAYPLTQFGTVVAWWWEVGFAIAGLWWVAHLGWAGQTLKTWAKRFDLRWLFLGVGIFTHGVLQVFLDIGTFTWVTFAFYLLWLDPPPKNP